MREKYRMTEKNTSPERPAFDGQVSLSEHVTLWLSLRVWPRCVLSSAPGTHSWTTLLASLAAGWVGHVTKFWPIGCERRHEHQAGVI